MRMRVFWLIVPEIYNMGVKDTVEINKRIKNIDILQPEDLEPQTPDHKRNEEIREIIHSYQTWKSAL